MEDPTGWPLTADGALMMPLMIAVISGLLFIEPPSDFARWQPSAQQRFWQEKRLICRIWEWRPASKIAGHGFWHHPSECELVMMIALIFVEEQMTNARLHFVLDSPPHLFDGIINDALSAVATQQQLTSRCAQSIYMVLQLQPHPSISQHAVGNTVAPAATGATDADQKAAADTSEAVARRAETKLKLVDFPDTQKFANDLAACRAMAQTASGGPPDDQVAHEGKTPVGGCGGGASSGTAPEETTATEETTAPAAQAKKHGSGHVSFMVHTYASLSQPESPPPSTPAPETQAPKSKVRT